MKIIGITGGIACGKSAVTRMFAAFGARTLSADDDARAVLQPDSPALAQVRAAFPDTFDDNALNRGRLAARIFADPDARHALEAITHPAIVARMRSAIDAARSSPTAGVLVYETPLLYEADLVSLFDAVIAVTTTPSQQARRLQDRERAAGRPALTDADIADRLAAQLSPDEKARRADFVIRNDNTLADTRNQARRVWDQLTGEVGD